MSREFDNTERIRIFRRLFSGRDDVYGTYCPQTGRARQVKAPVTDQVILDHINGRQSYGVYLLTVDRTRAVAVDFDDGDIVQPTEFVILAQQYGLETHIETSKSKGYHVWVFFGPNGVPAWKPRRIIARILDEIHRPDTEVFPKQDRLGESIRYGNFINAPLFGALVPKGKTVFLDRHNPRGPLPDQWELLHSIQPVAESLLDDIIDMNDLHSITRKETAPSRQDIRRDYIPISSTYGLPPCAQRMLAEGVTQNQRVSCFRLAVALRWTGLAKSLVTHILNEWAKKNRPQEGRRIITPGEIRSQVECTFSRNYRSRGCECESVRPFCDPTCKIALSTNSTSPLSMSKDMT